MTILSAVVATFFLTMHATKMWFYMDSYRDDYTLVESACFYSPKAWFAWHVRGMARWNVASYNEAVILWVMATLLSPKEYKVQFNLANALKLIGKEKDGDERMDIAMANVPLGQEEMAKGLLEKYKANQIQIVL